MYVWADGVYFSVRLEEDRLVCLVIMGVRADGTKEIIALEDGYRESQESWASLLRDLRRRGMPAPVLAIGDGALGFSRDPGHGTGYEHLPVGQAVVELQEPQLDQLEPGLPHRGPCRHCSSRPPAPACFHNQSRP